MQTNNQVEKEATIVDLVESLDVQIKEIRCKSEVILEKLVGIQTNPEAVTPAEAGLKGKLKVMINHTERINFVLNKVSWEMGNK